MKNRSPEQHEEEDFKETNEVGELKNYQGGIVVFDGSCNSYQKGFDPFLTRGRFEDKDVFLFGLNCFDYPRRNNICNKSIHNFFLIENFESCGKLLYRHCWIQCEL